MSGGFDFNTLSASLDPEERQRLLESIRAAGKADEAPVVEDAEPQIETLEERYHKLGFFGRLRLLLTQLFSGRSRTAVLTRWATQALAVRVQQHAGDGLDAKRRLFLDPFAEAIVSLATALSKVTSYLHVGTNRRVDLVLRLVESVAPSMHRKLMDTTSVSDILRLDITNEHELHKQLLAHVEGHMIKLGIREKQSVGRSLEQADALRRLGDFGFIPILSSFNGNASNHSRECAFDHVVRPIERLAIEFTGLRQMIDPFLIETLVLLEEEPRGLKDQPGAPSPSAGSEDDHDQPSSPEEPRDAVDAGTGVQKIQGVIALLRRIGKRYPMLSIARLIRNDPWWTPKELVSTDDWCALYRSAFAERIQRHVRVVSLRQRVAEQFKVLGEIGDAQPELVPGLETPGVRGFLRATALHFFVYRVYAAALTVLRLILTEGKFYKDSNRAQYNDTFSELERLSGRVTSLVENVAPGSAWAQALTGADGDQARDEVIAAVHAEIDAMTKHAGTTVELLVKLLGGVLYATAGSTYDTLANLGQIDGRHNSQFIVDARLIHIRMQRFASILNELIRIERNAGDSNIELDPSILNALP